MLQLPQPDGFLSAWDVKGVAADVIGEFPLPGIEGSSFDPDEIWPVVVLASVNRTSVREVCAENHETPYDTTVFDWPSTLDRGWFEFAANLLFMQLAMTIDFVANPYHGTYNDEEGELCDAPTEDVSARSACGFLPKSCEKRGTRASRPCRRRRDPESLYTAICVNRRIVRSRFRMFRRCSFLTPDPEPSNLIC